MNGVIYILTKPSFPEYVKIGLDLLQYAVSMYEHQDFWSALEGYGFDSAEAHCEALVAQNDLLGAVKYAKGVADADSKYNDLLSKYATPLVNDTL